MNNNMCCGECHTHPCPAESKWKVGPLLDVEILKVLNSPNGIKLSEIPRLKALVMELVSKFRIKADEIELLRMEIKQLKAERN